MPRIPRGVRQIGENVIKDGRALIVTSENFDDYNWDELPDGTLHVDANTGNISVKLKGETTWAPTGLKNDGTLVISKDTQFNVEVFTIESLNDGSNNYVYTNRRGERRHKPIVDNNQAFIFELEEGTYLPGRNHLEVTIDDVLIRTVMSGGVEEINEKNFKLCEPLEVGQEVTVKYVKWVKIGNPYPRIFLNAEEPDAENGDLWIDPNGTLDDGTIWEDIVEDEEATIPWERITGKPNTLAGYGIDKQVASVGHVHRALDITDFPSKLPANGGDADTVQGHAVGTDPNNILALDNFGKISASVLPANFLTMSGAIFIQDERPTQITEKTIWICTAEDNRHIEVYVNNTWVTVAS